MECCNEVEVFTPDAKQPLVGSRSTCDTSVGNTRQDPSRTKWYCTLWDKCYNSWYCEAAAAILSLSCVIAIMVVLICYNHAPVPQLRFGITLNAMISILATASKAALVFVVSNSMGQMKWIHFIKTERTLSNAELFDDASRGPFGAVRLLVSSARHFTGRMGAIILLLALPFDPFIQQIISYETNDVYTSSPTAIMLQARMYSSDIFFKGSPLTGIRIISSAADTDTFPWSPVCPSGNCAWPDFETLSWCGECHDDDTWTLSSDCRDTFTRTQLSALQEASSIRRNCTAFAADGRQQVFTFTLSKNITSGPQSEFRVRWHDYQIQQVFSSVIKDELMVVMRQMPEESVQDVESLPFLGVDTLRLIPSSNSTFLDLKFNIRARRCTLDFCLGKYDLRVKDSQATVKMTDHRPLVTKVISPEMIRTTPKDSSQYICKGPSSDIDTLIQRDPVRHQILQEDTYVGIVDYGNFTFCYNRLAYALVNATLPIQKVLFPARDAGWSTWVSQDLLNTTDTDLPALQPSMRQTDTEFDASPVQTMYYLGEDLLFNNLAASLTQSLLDSSFNLNSTNLVQGQVRIPLTKVKVRWVWLILPVALAIGSVLFLATTIYMSRKTNAPLWKSSINAYLYHGVEQDKEYHSNLTTLSEMAKQADITKVILTPSARDGKLILEATVVEKADAGGQ